MNWAICVWQSSSNCISFRIAHGNKSFWINFWLTKVQKSKQNVFSKTNENGYIYKKHFYEDNCVHGISEIFDGAEPKDGRGCIQQAWSVAALVKLYTDHQLYEIDSL